MLAEDVGRFDTIDTSGDTVRFKTRLMIGYAALLLVTAAIGGTAIIAMRTTVLRLETVARDVASEIIAVHKVRYQAEQLVATSRGYLLTGSTPTLARFDAVATQLGTALARLDSRAQEVKASAREYVAVARLAAHRRAATDDPQTIVPFFEKTVGPARDRFENAVTELVDQEQDAFDIASYHARRFAENAQAFVTFGVGIATLIGAALAWLSIRKLEVHYSRERAATEQARKAAALRDELLAVVSHDLRTPLQTIAIAASCFQLAELAALDRRRMTAIAAAADRMQHLIEQLVDVARIEGGKLVLRREPCFADALVDAALALFRERAEKDRIELTSRADRRFEIEVDRERVLQVLSNLVANALRFTPAGGEISVGIETQGRQTRFVITDSGPGVPAEDIPHLFERYWQGRANRHGSLGLGLYICKTIVTAHGGDIGVENKAERGASFWFTVPSART